MKQINISGNKAVIVSEKRSDTWEAIGKHHLYKEWNKLKNYFKSRGFNILTQEYHVKQKYAEPFNKVGYKDNGVCVILELCNFSITVEFGRTINLFDGHNHFRSDWNDGYMSPNYLENKAIEIELKKFCEKYNHIPQKVKINYQGVERILNDKRESCHSKDLSKLDELGLDGVVYQMSEYDHTQNSNDRNKKKINCGEEKYYYDGKILKKGKVYHQLNNRWFVLSGGDLDYVSSWELFDYNGEPRRKELKKEEKINRLERECRYYEEKKNYLRCMSINKQIEKLKSSEKVYNVWSLKWNKWWGANNNGYTSDKRLAGIYLESNILASQSYYNDGVSTKAVLVS